MTISCLIDVTEAGHRFEGYALIKAAQDGTTAKGDPYFNLTLGKKHRTIACKLWGNNFGPYDVAELKQLFSNGAIHYISGQVSDYRGELQLTIDSFRPVGEGEVDLADYLEAPPESIDALQAEFEQYIDEIKSPILQTITRELYENHQQQFITFPAGKSNHHAFMGGLLYHTVSMLRIAKHITSQYPQVNQSLLYAAIALHDMGKVVELSGYIAPDYTKVGNFLGHITIINMFIDRKAQKLKEDKESWTRADFNQVYELMHTISAHHGQLEWGSPVTSKLLEAEIIHHIDMLDSRINMIVSGLQDDHLGEDAAKRIYPLGNFYKTTHN